MKKSIKAFCCSRRILEVMNNCATIKMCILFMLNSMECYVIKNVKNMLNARSYIKCVKNDQLSANLHDE